MFSIVGNKETTPRILLWLLIAVLKRGLTSDTDTWTLDRGLVALRIANSVAGTDMISTSTIAQALSYSLYIT